MNTTTQRKPNSPYIKSVRPMSREDLQFLREKSDRRAVVRLRESHHIVARLLASGMPQNEVAARVGYTPTRVSVLKQAPAVQELIARYRAEVDEEWKRSQGDYYNTLVSNTLKAERLLADRIDDEINSDEPTMTIKELYMVSRDGADRIGYHKRSTKENINIDFAANLDAAIRRSRQIDLEANED